MDNRRKGHTAAHILRALVFIQNHLEEEILIEEVANAAYLSLYHFHRIFRGMTGETVYSLIQRLRTEKASRLLKYSEISVTEIALSSGYATPSAFAKAFKKITGVSPRQYRVETQKTMEKITMDSTKQKIMKPRKEVIPEQLVLFVREVGAYQTTLKLAWDKILQFAHKNQLDVSQEKLIGIAHDDPTITAQEKLRFDACITAPPNVKPEGEVGSQKLRGGRYAIFLHKGPYCSLEKSFEQIFADWYPTSGEEVAHFPCFCCHLNMEKERMQTAPETLLTEIYIPLK